MASKAVPSTPSSQPPQAKEIPPSPGNWRHPKFEEIARRQNAATFSDRSVRNIAWNTGALISTWMAESFIDTYPWLYNTVFSHIYDTAGAWPLFTLRLVFLYNIFTAFSPLIRDYLGRKDEFNDIALTPSQRALLGLSPDTTPPVTPGTQYITPPRYARSATPNSATPGSRGSSAANSPLSRRESPANRPNGDAYSPNASPLWQKAVVNRETRRQSYGLPSPFGVSTPGKDGTVFGAGLPSTPSPSGRGASVPLNSRWLYERGRSTSGSKPLYS